MDLFFILPLFSSWFCVLCVGNSREKSKKSKTKNGPLFFIIISCHNPTTCFMKSFFQMSSLPPRLRSCWRLDKEEEREKVGHSREFLRETRHIQKEKKKKIKMDLVGLSSLIFRDRYNQMTDGEGWFVVPCWYLFSLLFCISRCYLGTYLSTHLPPPDQLREDRTEVTPDEWQEMDVITIQILTWSGLLSVLVIASPLVS